MVSQHHALLVAIRGTGQLPRRRVGHIGLRCGRRRRDVPCVFQRFNHRELCKDQHDVARTADHWLGGLSTDPDALVTVSCGVGARQPLQVSVQQAFAPYIIIEIAGEFSKLRRDYGRLNLR